MSKVLIDTAPDEGVANRDEGQGSVTLSGPTQVRGLAAEHPKGW
jgi:hypothetical protein